MSQPCPQLDLDERRRLFRLFDARAPVTEIAASMGRHRSTITLEIRRNHVELERLPRVPLWVVGDRGYSSEDFRELIWSSSTRPAIPTRRSEATVACPGFIDNNRTSSSVSGRG